jgi:ATP-dependent DNA ligase
MLAQLEAQLPTSDEWRYEPKLDGFRGLLWHRAGGIVQLLSRNGRDLGPWFPELVQAGQTLPPCTLIDGELVIADEDGNADFCALQARLTEARAHLRRRAREHAAVLVVFDVLDVAGRGLMDEPLVSRRRELESLLADAAHPCLQLIEHTADVELARDWLRLLPIEGVVAKRVDGRYRPGRRCDWIKVKRYRTADCVVIGVAGDLNAPKLVLGLRHPDGAIHHLGRLGGVIRHLERAYRMPLQTRQRVLGRQCAQQQRSVFRDKTLSVSPACRKVGFKARPLPVPLCLGLGTAHASDVAPDLIE